MRIMFLILALSVAASPALADCADSYSYCPQRDQMNDRLQQIEQRQQYMENQRALDNEARLAIENARSMDAAYAVGDPNLMWLSQQFDGHQ